MDSNTPFDLTLFVKLRKSGMTDVEIAKALDLSRYKFQQILYHNEEIRTLSDGVKGELLEARLSSSLKRCSKCKETKPKTSFGPYSKTRDNLNTHCRDCSANYAARRREVVEEIHLSSGVSSVGDATCPRCRETKPVIEFSINRKTVNGRQTYCKGCFPDIKRKLRHDQQMTGPKKVRAVSMVGAAKKRARDRNEPWDIDVAFVLSTFPDVCPALGIPFDLTASELSDGSPTLDRFDSSKGYTQDNVWVISHLANRMKQAASIEQVELLAKNLRARADQTTSTRTPAREVDA